MNVTYEKMFNEPKERLSSLPQYPSGQYLYYNWEHDSFKSSENESKRTPKAFIRNYNNGNL